MITAERYKNCNIFRLDAPETDCTICGTPIAMQYGLPMYEGKIVLNPDEHEWAGYSVCKKCFEKYNPMINYKKENQ